MSAWDKITGDVNETIRVARTGEVSSNNDLPFWDGDERDIVVEKPYQPRRRSYQDDDADQKMNKSFVWRLVSRFLPQGYRTYIALALLIIINILSFFGIPVPGFEAVVGNEGIAVNAALIMGYLRSAMKRS